MKIISPKLHGIIDYLVVLFLFAAPTIFAFTPNVALFTYALGSIHLLLTVLTNFKPGLIKLIPLPLHALIELVVGIVLVILAYTFFKDDAVAKLFYTAFGGAVLAVFFLSDYKSIS